MDIAYPHVAERLFGRPLAIEPQALRAIMDGPLVKRVLSGDKIGGKQAKKGRDIRRDRLALIAQAEQVKSPDGMIEYGITAEGIAIVPIAGVLSRRFDWLAAACGWTTYDGLGATLDAIGDDYRVRGVLLDVDSPGGEADGMLDIADAILNARSDDCPVWAVANSLAASAAYALAGSASTLYLPRLAQVGSIGCVTIHVDQSASDEAMGLNYTAIYSGARKIDGWGHAPLSDGARQSAQSGVDHVREQFADLVARQGRISQKAALATEAQVYADNDALKAGLADRIGTFNDALEALTEKVSPKRFTGANTMSKKDKPAVAAVIEQPAVLPVADPAPATAVAAVTDPAAPAAASVAEAAAVSAEMDPPKPGEPCKLCGQMYDDNKDAKKANAIAAVDPAHPSAASLAAPTAATTYGEAEMNETMEVCQLAKLSLADAQAFINAKTPVAKVRATVLAKVADKSNALQTTATPLDKSSFTSWGEVAAKVNKEFGIQPK